jgi:hypothetical protein
MEVVVRKYLSHQLAALSLLLSQPPSFAQNSVDLPAGTYIFLGTDPGHTAPRLLTIDTTGKTTWVTESTTDQQLSTMTPSRSKLAGIAPFFKRREPNKNQSTPNDFYNLSPTAETSSSIAQVNTSSNIESSEYPTIKWKPQQVLGSKEGIAQLATTYSEGTIKAKLTLFKVKKPTDYATTITLLDKDGFEIKDIAIFRFSDIPGTSLYEGHGESYMQESGYQKTAGYSVRVR